MKTYTEAELAKVLKKHKLWLADDPAGVRANLAGANLYRADLTGANLAGADLSGAVVLAVYDAEGNPCDEARSGHDSDFLYRVGETVKPTGDFDTNRWKECAPGIHFFITRSEAEGYVL